jgi:1-acyl-sn-glycerol-3-phosphate acyltransferase
MWTPKHSKEFRKLSYWKWFLNEYFKFKPKGPGAYMVDPKKVNPDKQVIFAMHPHGLFACSSSYWAFSPHLTHVRGVGTSIMFYIPLVKEIISLGGGVRANRQDILSTLQCGESVFMTPGGMREILTHQKIYEKHLGFLKIAKATGVPVVPVYGKGVKELYDIWLPWPWLQSILLHMFLYPGVIFAWGNPWIPFWPKKLENGIELWMGEPMEIKGNIKKEAKKFYNQMKILKNKAEK